jgi:hypothetical protein
MCLIDVHGVRQWWQDVASYGESVLELMGERRDLEESE